MEDELLIKFLLNETNEEESLVVQEWLAADRDHERYFAQFEKIWKAGQKLAAFNNVDADTAWLQFRERAAVQDAATSSGKRNAYNIPVRKLNSDFSWLKVAAALVLIAGAWLSYELFGPGHYKELTALNGVITEKLPDGSELTLNRNTELSYAADFKDHRNVKLKHGDVFFNVAHNKKKPFVINIDQVSVTVVGTSFNIKYLKAQTEIIVETGIVRVERNGEQVELHKGEKVSIPSPAARLQKVRNKDQLYNYYRSNLFTAVNTTLQRLVDVMNEAYSPVEIVLDDPSLQAEEISTTFRADAGLDYSLKMICETLNLKQARNENKILLSRLK